MTTGAAPHCPRLFEVEALRDGRLSGAELARFRTHLGLCQECAREARALEALAADLRNAAHTRDNDELRIRRERTRLLAAFDATLVPDPPQRFTQRRPAFVGAFAALGGLLVVLVLWHGRPRSTAAVPPVSSAEAVTVHADSSARFTRQADSHLERIVLESGALSIRVERAHSARRLLVILPDGELEDIGTTFSVSADAGHTTRVTVQEGSVVLRLRGNSTIVLAAGDAWTRAASPSVASSAPPQAPSSAPGAKVPHAVHLAPGPSTRTPDRGRGPDAAPVPTPDLPGDHSADFRAAMSAFNAGNYGEAAERFGTYLASHSGDPRAEDAAYLRVLALQHGGSASGTRQAARDYLARYPRGFRRAEVEALSR